MLGKRFWITVLSVATLLAASAVAQDEKNEVGGALGRTFISNQGIQNATYPPTISYGNGLSFEIEYARHLWVTPVFSVSGEVVFMDDHDQDINGGAYGHAVLPQQLSMLFLTPAVRLNLFPTTAVSPWISVGGGFGHIGQNSMLLYGGANPGTSTTSGVFEGGFGLDVKVWRKLSMRGEVRDFWSGAPDFPLAPTGDSRQHHYFVGGGVFWRF
jgi:hypothetical protein